MAIDKGPVVQYVADTKKKIVLAVLLSTETRCARSLSSVPALAAHPRLLV